MSTMPTTMTLRSSRSPWRRALVVLGYACLLLFAVLEVTPFLLTIANSFKCLPAVQEYPQGFIPLPPFGVDCRNAEGVTLPASATAGRLTFNPALEGYEEVFSFNLPRWFLNSVVYSVGITLLRVLLDSMAGYALARLNFRGNRTIFLGILGTMMIPAIVEKGSFGIPAIVLFLGGRLSLPMLGAGLIDLLLGILFLVAFVLTSPARTDLP